MDRNTEIHFTELPEVNIKRSKFYKSTTHKTSFNAASIIPIYVDEVLPADSIKMKMSAVVRMSTPLFPTMDNAYLDIFWFYVPTRLIWTHWKEFWGESTSPWIQSTEYKIPKITTDSNAHLFGNKTIADYMGIPTLKPGLKVNALPFRAYVKIWNDWFRDTNLQQEAANTMIDGETPTSQGTTDISAMNYAYKGGTIPLKANKFHDYFTSALPNLQRGPQSTLPLGSWAPVTTRSTKTADSTYPLSWSQEFSSDTPASAGTHLLGIYTSGGTQGYKFGETGFVTTAEPEGGESSYGVYPDNLWTDLSNATAATITSLREAIAVQHFFELLGRTGNRYTDFLKGVFGVTTSDARLQRSEFLGAKRIPINITTVLQNSSTTSTSPLGQTGAMSHTVDADEYFTKSFEEHGYLMGLAVVRTDHTYNQGIERMWSRTTWEDFFIPQLENLSEQAILNKEIYAQGTDEDEEAFGYQERYAEYKYKPSIVTGEFRTTYTQTLDAWHYADHYNSLPILGSEWIQETKENIDRTLAVSSTNSDQFLADFYFNPTYVRPMQIYAIPGLETI